MKYSRGKRAWGECARSGRRMLLRDMVADGYYPDLIVDPAWRDERHPQEHLPALSDPAALYRPAPEDLPAASAVELIVEVPAAETGPMYVVGTKGGGGAQPWQVSDDGVTFTTIAQATDADNIVWIHEQQQWIAVGDGVWTSPDGTTWTQRIVGGAWFDVAYTPFLGAINIGRLVVFANGATQPRYSDDAGVTWTTITDIPGGAQTDSDWVEWDEYTEKFLATINGGGALIYSSNGINWPAAIGFSGPYDEMVPNHLGSYVAVRELGAGQNIRNNVFGDPLGLWVGGGVTTGNEGISVDFGFGIFVMNGVNAGQNVVFRSSDLGVSWANTNVGASATLGTRMQVRADPTRNRWWYVSANRVHRSPDGTATGTWVQATSGTALSCIGVRRTIG